MDWNAGVESGLDPNAAWQQVLTNFNAGQQQPGFQATGGGQQPDMPKQPPAMFGQLTPEQQQAQMFGGVVYPQQQQGGGATAGTNFLSTPNSAPIPGPKSMGTGGGGSALASQLMGMGQQQYGQQMAQYQQLMNSIMGKGGLFSQLGKTGNQQINQQQQQQSGQLGQNLTSRGLTNSTIAPALQGGIARNAQMERNQLNEGIAGQKIGASEQLFNMNPSPKLDTYLNLLTRLGGQGGGGGAGNVGTLSR